MNSYVYLKQNVQVNIEGIVFFLQTILFQGTLGNMIYETTHVSLYSIYKKI